LFIQNAEFFTSELVMAYDAKSKSRIQNQPILFYRTRKTFDSILGKNDFEYKEYGLVADRLGARINADYIKIKIKVGNEEHSHLFPRRKNPYLIKIENATGDGGSKSDMPIYQKYWGVENPEEIDLMVRGELDDELKRVGKKFDNSKAGNPVGTRKTCYLVTSGEPSIESFI
jgi:hypothetical protein